MVQGQWHCALMPYTWLREVAWEGNQTFSSDTRCTDYCSPGQAPQPWSLWFFSRFSPLACLAKLTLDPKSVHSFTTSKCRQTCPDWMCPDWMCHVKQVCKSSWPRGEGPHFCMFRCILTWYSLIAIWNFMWGRQEWDRILLWHLASASPHRLLYLWRTWSVIRSVCRAGWKKHSVTYNCTNLILLNPIYPVGCLLWELIQDCAETCLWSTN